MAMSTKLSAEILAGIRVAITSGDSQLMYATASIDNMRALLDHITALEEELKRFEYPCGGCGGPHEYDTSVPSPLWNRVVREQGLSDYLCASCIVKVFARARTSFTAKLYGPELDGDEVPTISVQVNGVPIDDSYGDLQFRLRELESELKAAQEIIDGAMDDIRTCGEMTCDECNLRTQALRAELKAAQDEIERLRGLMSGMSLPLGE